MILDYGLDNDYDDCDTVSDDCDVDADDCDLFAQLLSSHKKSQLTLGLPQNQN